MSAQDVAVNLNAVWTVVASLLVYVMHGGFGATGAAVACALLRAGGWLRVGAGEEEAGSDRTTHGEETEGNDQAREPQP